VLTRSNSSKKTKSSEDDINKFKTHVNRGFELILNGGIKKKKQPFHVIIEKMVRFFNREVTIYFEFSLSSRKRKVVPRGKKNVSS